MKHEYDPAKHVYTIGGFEVPSVTRILDDLLPGFKAADWYMQRGRANHACYALLAQGKQFKADEQSEGNIRAWKAWNEEFKPEFKYIERQVYSDKFRFAGTLDAVAIIPKLGVMALVDYKESLSQSVPYQLGAYALAAKETLKVNIKFGIGVELTHTGTWAVTPVFELARYSNAFLTLLSAYNIRAELNKTGKG